MIMQNSKNLQLYFAVIILIIIISGSIAASVIATHNPYEPDMLNRLQPPSLEHYFGTDALGRDMFSRILYGGRASMLLSVAAAVLSLGIGLLIGSVCGFYGGKLDLIFTSVSNIFQSIPGSCFMIAVTGILGPSIKSLILALVITSWAGFSRIVRAEVMQIKKETFIEGLYCIGCSDIRIITRHIFPNIFNKLLVLFTIRIGRGILAVAGLSFLGLGVQAPMPSLGSLANAARDGLTSYPYKLIFPAVTIVLIVLAFNLLGDGLRDALDPTMKEM